MIYKRIIIDLAFTDATNEQANQIRDAIATEACSEDNIMPVVFETLEANSIKCDVTWEVRGETWRPEAAPQPEP
jgi:hypothetical protein